MTPEGRVKDKVKKLLRLWGWWYFMPVSNGMGRHGIPDLICCRPTLVTPDMVGKTVGMFVAIETKAPGKRNETTPNQEREITEISQAGGTAVVIDDPDSLKQVLDVFT